ncbi:non-ribosomal peptide synthetase [Peristeroidobacter soli]|nr:non-ribosomal peptide synthetase [Peristeroidobacter soli]
MSAADQSASERLQSIARQLAAMAPAARKARLRQMRVSGLSPGRLPIVPAVSAREVLSYAQLRQWFLWQLDKSSTAYHISSAVKLSGRLDASALKGSFDGLVARHESLRTVFRGGAEGEVEQIVRPESRAHVEEIDVSDVAVSEREAAVRAAVTRFHHRPFDLEHGPLLRIALVRIAADSHVLVVIMHHIVSDGWSMRILIDEFVEQYRARVRGELPALPALPIQYADYAVWQRNWLEAGEKDSQLAYWREQLGSEHPVLSLPTDRPRNADARYTAACHAFELDPELTRELRRRTQSEGATLFMALLAGFQVLLHRYTGHEDIRVGVPIANRHRAETERVVGFFVNTQVLCTKVHGRMSLLDVLGRVKDAALGAQGHQDLPFEQVVEALAPARTLGSSPLFQVMFNHQREEHRVPPALPDLILEGYELTEQGAQFELTMDSRIASDGRALVSFAYAAELFDSATVVRLGAHYLRVLTELARCPEQAVREVQLLSEAERAKLQRWGVNSRRYANVEPVHRLIARRAHEQPEATALICGQQVLTYGELNRRANRLAHRLIALGVAADSKVGLAIERSCEMVVALLAILKAGGAYVPLDPDYPAQRRAYMVEDSGIELLLTQRDLQDHASIAGSAIVLTLETLDVGNEADDEPHVDVHGEQLAYVIYTSGSTGKPKGIGISHASLSEHSQVAVGYFGLTPCDRMLQFSTINFDAFVEQLFPPLIVGAAVVLRGPTLWDSEMFHRELLDKRITIADLPTAYWNLLAQDFARVGSRDYGALRQVQATGEAMPAEAVKAWREAGLGNVKLLNTYGPTETVVTAMAHDCSADAAVPTLIPIGHPLAGRHTYVLDIDLNLTPPGATGELYIGGDLLARGYHGRPGLSAERFIADPFDAAGGRLYRTGDVVRWNRDGRLEYLGRVDHQVKVRGFRVELGEIETQLLLQSGIREALVVAQAAEKGARLIGYVAGDDVRSADLKSTLSASLPDYMIPSAIVVLPVLPKNANGKIDRAALPLPELTGDVGYVAPQGAIEQAIATIWAEVLGVERVGRNDNFFELGGHSLMALRVIDIMRRRLQVHPPIELKDLFTSPSLEQLASRRAHAAWTRLNSAVPDVPPLTMIHDGLGNILDYTQLAQALDRRCPVVALPYSHASDGASLASLDALARVHARTIVAAGIREPYRLCGWCVGGAIAPLVAGVLESEGRRVDFVGAIDPYVQPRTPGAIVTAEAGLLSFIAALFTPEARVEQRAAAAIRQRISHAVNAPETLVALLHEVLALTDEHGLRPHARLGAAELATLFLTGRALDAMARVAIDPAPLRAPMSVWWAHQRTPQDRERFQEWFKSPHTRQYEVHADHYEAVRAAETIESLEQALR